MPLVVATHNLMSGLRLPQLQAHYARLRDSIGLHVLCVQENRESGVGTHVERIAAELGARYRALCETPEAGMGVVYDAEMLRVLEHRLIPLPRLASLTWAQRRYIAGGRPDQRFAQLVRLRPARGAPLAVANFHLDTAGSLQHRRAQLRHIVDWLRDHRLDGRAIACGDTNAFRWRRQRAALRQLLAPLAELGARDPHTAPTHFFARQNEPKLTHRIAVALGRMGLDLPQRYDVICTNLRVRRRGQVPTPDSDHDLVWADVEP